MVAEQEAQVRVCLTTIWMTRCTMQSQASATTPVDMGVNASHCQGHAMFCLKETGVTTAITSTRMATQCTLHFSATGTGLRICFTDPSLDRAVNDYQRIGYACGDGPSTCTSNTPGPLRAAGPQAYNYSLALSATFLEPLWRRLRRMGGLQGDWSVSRIWMLGWNDGNGGEDPYLDGATASYIFRHGDYVCQRRDNQLDFWISDTLPSSFYLSGQP